MRGRGWLALVGAGMAVAITAFVVLLFRPQRPVELPPGARAIEPRVSWPPAAAHRPYDLARGGAGDRALVPAPVLARLEKEHDEQALGAAYLIIGDVKQAQAHLARAPRSPARETDEAAAALLAHDPEPALVHADAALRERAGMAAAEWNRALALRDLGLERVAAETFEHVASRAEPGWADEARTRAQALHHVVEARVESQRAAAVAATMLSASGKLPPDALVRAHPDLFRTALVAALGSARVPADREHLLPLARTLDTLAGADALAPLVAAPPRKGPPADPLLASLDRDLRAAEALAARRDQAGADRLLTAVAQRADAARLDTLVAEAYLARAQLFTPGAGVPSPAAEALGRRAAELLAVAAPARAIDALHVLERLTRARGGAELADAYAREAALARTP